MKLGLVIYSNDAETVWNALRFGVFACKKGDQVRAFLLGRGVEAERLGAEPFDVPAQLRAFVDAGGELLACGTCLKVRDQGGSETCPISTMQDLYELIDASDRVLTF